MILIKNQSWRTFFYGSLIENKFTNIKLKNEENSVLHKASQNHC